MKQPIDPNFLVHPSTFWHQFMLGRIGRSSSFMERLVGLGYFQKEERSSDQLTLIIRIYDICIGCIGIYRGTNANHLLIINSFILPWKKRILAIQSRFFVTFLRPGEFPWPLLKVLGDLQQLGDKISVRAWITKKLADLFKTSRKSRNPRKHISRIHGAGRPGGDVFLSTSPKNPDPSYGNTRPS